MTKKTMQAVRPRRAPTLDDVARQAEVSRTSVSMVVNGTAQRLRPETRHRIEDAIRHLNYRPNKAARDLRFSRGVTVAIVVMDNSPAFMGAPFTAHLVAGLCNRLSAEGQSLTLQGIQPDQMTQAHSERYAQADGLCLLLSGKEDERDRAIESFGSLGVPIVLFQERPRRDLSDCCVIRQMDREGGRMIAEDVLQSGARTIVIALPAQSWYSVDERVRGMRDAIAKVPDARVELLPCGDESGLAVAAAIDRRLASAPRPDAILGTNDRIAIAVLNTVAKNGLTVPDDIRVTGFNGFDPRDLQQPTLTSVASAAYQLGVAGAESLLARLQTGSFAAPEITLPVQLLPGNSTRRA
ncbi:LacI family DNA-binding transcriptional regulator [Acuticoccus sediminis]|uniref:LacI family DNA-binding transcriptional regulator n=1 Tax=Acuticoccus sediminis TaxID=2184697 RepID=UPI001CFD7932|nr:LacI family DNA-binding transcriptional regulator [Acuticoccus sediminis]